MMYNLEIFEQLIKSNLSAEEIYNRVISLNPIETKEKYSNDEDKPFAIYVGGLGKEDLVTINNALYPLKMRFDIEQIYIDFINLIRQKMESSDKTFSSIVMASIRNLSRNWFYNPNSQNAIENAKLAKLYLDAFKHPGRQRDAYASDERVAVFNEEQEEIVYNISKFEGTGDLAKCSEVNSVACNLLAFSGLQSVLVQGYFINYNGKKEAHTFPIYKSENGNYNLLDCMLKIQRTDILSGDIDFSNGFNFEVPTTLSYPDGRKEEAKVEYIISPQKKLDNIREILK